MLRRVIAAVGASAVACGAVAGMAAAASGATTPLPKATNGKTVAVVATGLTTPTSFAFGGGSVFEGDGGNPPKVAGGVYQLKAGTATRLTGSPVFVAGLAWHNKSLYISGAEFGAGGAIVSKLWKWSGWNGTKFTSQKVIYTAPKGFPGFNGIAFGPDGRLYAGVDVSLDQSNDHGPATKKTPYLYDILSFDARGKHLTVYATGMRQPWQLAFAPGDKNPFVTDFGQDQVIQNPPDFVLHVHKGDNYGFPQCTQLKSKLCKGFAKPFQLFAPHTDVGGIAIVGKRIYLSEFGFAAPLRQPQVVSIPLKGGKATPLVTGFPAHDGVIGLGASKGWIYFGDTNGTVYRVHT